MRASASLAALLILCLAAVPASGQSVIPIVELTVAPVEQFVNVTTAPVEAAFDCTVFVEGLPLVRYRVNLTAVCEGWEARCDPAVFTITGSANTSFKALVTVPAGTSSTMQHQVEIWANVSTTGVPLVSTEIFALVSVWPSYGLKLATDIQRVSVDAGAEVVWPFTLQNTGNGMDTFGLTVVNSASFAGWTVTCNRTSVSVNANHTVNLKYTIRPPSNALNQTLILQMRAFSRNAAFENLTVEQKLELEISVNATLAGGNGTKPTDDKKSPIPGAGGPALALTLLLAAIVAFRRRK